VLRELFALDEPVVDEQVDDAPAEVRELRRRSAQGGRALPDPDGQGGRALPDPDGQGGRAMPGPD
jgi:hypothetical protein